MVEVTRDGKEIRKYCDVHGVRLTARGKCIVNREIRAREEEQQLNNIAKACGVN